MSAPPRRLPFAILSGDGLRAANDHDPLRAPSVGTAGRIELLALWAALSDEGRRFVLTMARAKVEEERPK